MVGALLENRYPRRFIYQSASTPPPREAIAGGSENPKATVCLPYIRGVSEQLRRVLKDLQIRTVMRPHQTLRQRLVHLKDPLPDMERSNMVYRIPSAECPATYIGETKRKLCKRIEEHKRALRMCDFNASAVAEHAWNAGHHADWSGVTILDLDQNLHHRLTLEACHIRMQPSPVNRDRGLYMTTF